MGRDKVENEMTIFGCGYDLDEEDEVKLAGVRRPHGF